METENCRKTEISKKLIGLFFQLMDNIKFLF